MTVYDLIRQLVKLPADAEIAPGMLNINTGRKLKLELVSVAPWWDSHPEKGDYKVMARVIAVADKPVAEGSDR